MKPTDTSARDAAVQQNRRVWNETAAIHERVRMPALMNDIARGNFSTLDATEARIFASLGVERGLAVAQLCCNNARELLSLALRDAGRCTGFDLSDAFIDQGRRLAAAAKAHLELVCTSVYDIPTRFDGLYDVVYVTVGALGWMPDLAGFLAVAARLLAPGGSLFIYEMHPLLDMLDPDSGLTLKHSYFRHEPYVNEAEADYYDPSTRVNETSFWYHYTLAELFTGCLRRGLAITHFEEHAHDVSTVFAHLAAEHMLPLSYTLIARKRA